MPSNLLDQIEKYNDSIRNLTFMDDDFSREALNKAGLQSMLQKVKNDPSLELDVFTNQKVLNNFIGRSACSDFYAMDKNHIHYIVELQNGDKGAVVKRLRFLGSLVDKMISEPNDEWKEFQEIYVLMICRNDVLKGDQSIYHIEPFIVELSKKADMKITYVVVPIEGNNDECLGQLMRDLCEKDPHKIVDPALKEAALYYKEREGRLIMCKIMDDIENRGRAEGLAEGRAEGIAEGRAEGLAEGRVEGRVEGKVEGAIEIAKKMLNELNLSYDIVEKCTGLSIEQIKSLYATNVA